MRGTPLVPNRQDYSRAYVGYVLLMLAVVNGLSAADRTVFGIVIEPIKAEFQLSDTQIGLLAGIAFGMFYALFGLVIARFADTSDRRALISGAIVVWSGITVWLGMATSFLQLFLARVGLGIGEAGALPPTHSLVSDYVPANRRASAFAIIGVGGPLGVLLGTAAGGYVAEEFGWRAAFLFLGAIGLIVGPIVGFSIHEPARGRLDAAPPSGTQGLVPAVRTLMKTRSFVAIALAAAANLFVVYGVLSWLGPFFIRSHGFSLGEAGLAIGLIVGCFGGAGALLGGFIADGIGRRRGDPTWLVRAPAIALVLSAPFSLAVYLVSSAPMALACAAAMFCLNASFQGPVFSAIQNVAPVSMRATASALALFTMSFLGVGLGSYAVGLISDLLRPYLGNDSLRGALICLLGANLLASALYLLASRWLRADLQAATSQRTDPSPAAADFSNGRRGDCAPS
jgi:predicted MFS family arabinose efflux permease